MKASKGLKKNDRNNNFDENYKKIAQWNGIRHDRVQRHQPKWRKRNNFDENKESNCYACYKAWGGPKTKKKMTKATVLMTITKIAASIGMKHERVQSRVYSWMQWHDVLITTKPLREVFYIVSSSFSLVSVRKLKWSKSNCIVWKNLKCANLTR